MSGKAKHLLIKVFGVVFTLFILNVILIFFFPEVYASKFLITLLLTNLFLAIDYLVRPLFFQAGKKDQFKTKTLFLILFIFACPFLIAFPYLEYSFLLKTVLPLEVTIAFWIIGTIMIMLGGSTIVTSRIILGVQGSLKIGIEENHKLITKGPYQVIRHPIYAGTLFLLLGYSLSFSSIISSIIILLVLVPLGRGRMALEEKLLTETFGDEYLAYMKRTKRLIPYLY